MPESKVSVPTGWWVQIDRTWKGVPEILGAWDDKLPEFLEEGFIRIISYLIKVWVVDGIEKKGISSRKTTRWDT